MAGFTDYLERVLLDHIFTDPAWTPPATLYLGLGSGSPIDDAGGGLTEVSPTGTGYARQPVTAAEMAAATGTAPVSKASSSGVNYPTAAGSYAGGANLTHWLLFDALTGGNLLMTGLLSTPKPILTGDTPQLAAGALVAKLGDPGDTY